MCLHSPIIPDECSRPGHYDIYLKYPTNRIFRLLPWKLGSLGVPKLKCPLVSIWFEMGYVFIALNELYSVHSSLNVLNPTQAEAAASIFYSVCVYFLNDAIYNSMEENDSYYCSSRLYFAAVCTQL